MFLLPLLNSLHLRICQKLQLCNRRQLKSKRNLLEYVSHRIIQIIAGKYKVSQRTIVERRANNTAGQCNSQAELTYPIEELCRHFKMSLSESKFHELIYSYVMQFWIYLRKINSYAQRFDITSNSRVLRNTHNAMKGMKLCEANVTSELYDEFLLRKQHSRSRTISNCLRNRAIKFTGPCSHLRQSNFELCD